MRIASFIFFCAIAFMLACLGYGCVAHGQTIGGQDHIRPYAAGGIVSPWPIVSPLYYCPKTSWIDQNGFTITTSCPNLDDDPILNPPSDAELAAAMGYCRLKGEFHPPEGLNSGHYDWGPEWVECYKISKENDRRSGRDFVHAIAARLP